MPKKALPLFMLLLLTSPLFALWPTDGVQYVDGNFGTYEDGFHDALDIYGAPGITKCTAISRMQLVNVDSQWDSYNVDFYLPDFNKYVGYTHIKKLQPSDSGYLDFDSPSVIGTTLQSGDAFGVIASTSDAHTTFSHVHFQVYVNYPDWHLSAINPLSSNLIAPSDPQGDYPKIGPVYLKRNSIYITTNTPTYPDLWGKIEVVSCPV